MRLLPLAITKVDDHEACVGAVTEAGEWIRPEPVTTAQVTASDPPFRYWRRTEVPLGPSPEPGARPEDRAVRGTPVLDPASYVPPEERPALLERLCAPDAEAAVGGARRTLGLIRAEVLDVTVRRATGGRAFLRCRFRDGAGAEYDWIVPEIAFGARVWPHVHDGRLDPEYRAGLLASLRGADTFLTLGLTKPNDRFPNRFGGCHPLVVGVHSAVPDRAAGRVGTPA
ncbi:hypothetical protein Skr01_69130 [Sphaerisporangium krabiense]|uniref:Uncharacterized protein n=1 Tax=Sphaerisporangium krabiense TaxID=763782 RepID=A0A7W9DRG4_9ACTN|nr:hypothetical protein [Sphaerisporangium krabiense]MBB5628433.1 hypothetical protein [Sphaerisporangium krabiense]GII66828.1 hypothetical protein Skr01_69130 [Sphaerisporangium krabiense]